MTKSELLKIIEESDGGMELKFTLQSDNGDRTRLEIESITDCKSHNYIHLYFKTGDLE